MSEGREGPTYLAEHGVTLIVLWRLSGELVTRKPEDFEAKLVVLLVQLFQARVLHINQLVVFVYRVNEERT